MRRLGEGVFLSGDHLDVTRFWQAAPDEDRHMLADPYYHYEDIHAWHETSTWLFEL